jgi:hypothetical protein
MATHPALRRFRLRRPPGNPGLELADIQGNVLRPYGFQQAQFLFARVDDAEAARPWLRRLADRVTSAAPWTDGKPDTTLNVRFTYAGLQAIGLPNEALASFPDAFREGMAARASLLGDVGANSPSGWEPGLGTGEAHMLVRVDAQDAGGSSQVERLREESRRRRGRQRAALGLRPQPLRLRGGRRRVAVLGRPHPTARRGTPAVARMARSPGEFVLGYEDEDLPDGRALRGERHLHGYRKYFMDVLLFTRLREHGRTGGTRAARRQDHGPLARRDAALPRRTARPGSPPIRPGRRLPYGDDLGLRCPLAAHIRRPTRVTRSAGTACSRCATG